MSTPSAAPPVVVAPRRVSPTAAAIRSHTSTIRTYNAAIVLTILAIAGVIAWSVSQRAGSPPMPLANTVQRAPALPRAVLTETRPPATSGTSSPANLAIKMDDWRRLIVGTGEPCDRVTRTFRTGADAKGTTFTSVGCADGHTYQVSGKANDLASVRVLSCAMLYTVAKLRCFVPLNDQR